MKFFYESFELYNMWEFIKQNLSTILIFGILISYILYQRIPVYFSNKTLEEKPLRNLALQSLNGQIFHLYDFRDKAILINFWATWCIPCKLEMPILESLHQDLKEDLVIIGITNETKSIVESYLKEKNINYLIVLDNDYQLANFFNVQGYPTLILIKDGKIIDVATGFNPFIKWKIKWHLKRIFF